MSSGPKNVTSTTNSEPPAFLQGPLRGAVGAVGQDFNARDPQASNLLSQSRGVTSDTLAGNYLSPDSNPFLQQTFNRAADLTQGRLASEFAGSGRDLGASRPARSEELQTLSSNIFGGNFQQERDRQVSAVDQSQALDPINQLINRLAGIIPGAGGSTQSTQPVFRTGIF